MTNKRYSIDFIKSIAESRRGKCLSINYSNSQQKIEWQCEKGHIWEARASNVKNSESWCPECGKLGRGRKNKLNTKI